MRYVKAKHRSKHDVYLSWDEWNVWYKARAPKHLEGVWTEAPHLLEEVYNLEDALVVAQWMNVFLRKSDVLKIACLAQIVNVIAPILTNNDSLLKQTIYYPFALFSKFAVGAALDVAVTAPSYSTKKFGDMPMIDVSASFDEANNKNSIFIVNRSLTESLPVDLCWQDRKPQCINAIYQVAGTDPQAANTFDNPNQIVSMLVTPPTVTDNTATLMLPPLSFTAIDTWL
jgi:alpha-N-arabinofuranosidase